MSPAENIAGGFEVERLSLRGMEPRVVAAWAGLERRALEPNAYLSPCFVLPALRHLDPEVDPLIIAVYAAGPRPRELVGLGVFVEEPPTWRFPLRSLTAYRSKHSYITGLLVDRDRAEPVLERFLEFFSSGDASWDCVQFPHSRRDGALMSAIGKRAASAGMSLSVRDEYQRAVLVLSQAGGDSLASCISGRDARELQRQRRRLGEQGALSWRLLMGNGVDMPGAMERFTALEDKGWKSAQGSSLRSDPRGSAFARELGERFGAAGQLFFMELLLDGVPIASACNLTSGSAGFAFKVGWDPAYKRFGPGMLNELYFIEEAPKQLEGIVEVDSGAQEGSFLDALWAGRQVMATVSLPTSCLAKALFAARRAFQPLRSAWRRGRA